MSPMPTENKKLNSAKLSGYPVYYQKITINYKLGKGILLFLYSRKREFSTFFRITTKTMNQMTTCSPFILPKNGKPEKIHMTSKKHSSPITIFIQQATTPGTEEEIFRFKVYNTTFFFQRQ